MTDLDNNRIDLLYSKAKEARTNAYAPYSKFNVGAAVLTSDGEIFTGANVENASYGLTICAERAAIFSAVNSGASRIDALLLVADTEPGKIVPCGACLQVMSEFMDDVAQVICCTLDSGREYLELRDLLPRAFRMDKEAEDDR